MITTLLMKACGIWFLIIPLAIANGLARENVLVPLLGRQAALPVSGLTLATLIFGMTFLCIPFLGLLRPAHYWAVGALWLSMTVIFEFLFGHFVMGKAWSVLLEAYRVHEGNLWVLVLLVTALSPSLAAKLRGLIP